MITTTLPQRQLGFMGHEFQRHKSICGKFSMAEDFLTESAIIFRC